LNVRWPFSPEKKPRILFFFILRYEL